MHIGTPSLRKISAMLILVMLFTATVQSQKYNQTDSLKKHIYYLASDELTGRKPGTPGIEKAAAYISQQFKEIGLKSFNGSYFQPFKLLMGASLGNTNTLQADGKTLKLGTDFIPSEISGNGKASGKVVFIGYGMDKNMGKASFEGIDVKGKWVIVVRGSIDPADKSARAMLTGDYSKAMTAADKGALGVLFVNPAWNKDDAITLKTMFSRSMGNVNIPVIQITPKVALSLINKKADFLDKFPIDNEPASFETNKSVTAETSFELQYQTTNNIVGYIEGSDPKLKAEYIVVGGHYDHLGMGGQGSGSRKPDTIAIHHGADDNASGAAGVIEMARRIMADKNSFGRSFIFIDFSAEELGLIGSQYYVSNPTVPMASIKGMINLDMVGRLKDELTIEGTGSSAESDSILNILGKGRSFKVTSSAGASGGSDHTSFYNKGVPVFFFFSGMHYDYHTPSDTPDKINYSGEAAILDMAFDLAKIMGTSKPFTYKQVANQMATGTRTYKISLGIMPDVSGSRNDGVEVMDARKGGPAEQAGIKKGDFIISVEGKEVNNITEYMSRLNLLKKGEKANVGIRRNGEKIVIVVQL
jgi:aminopeptidase YwaD